MTYIVKKIRQSQCDMNIGIGANPDLAMQMTVS